MMAGGEPVWLPEITYLRPKISPSKFKSIHSCLKADVSVPAPVLLAQTDFRKNQFSPDCGHFSAFDYVNSASFSFLYPLVLRKEISVQMLSLSACSEDVLQCESLCTSDCSSELVMNSS